MKAWYKGSVSLRYIYSTCGPSVCQLKINTVELTFTCQNINFLYVFFTRQFKVSLKWYENKTGFELVSRLMTKDLEGQVDKYLRLLAEHYWFVKHHFCDIIYDVIMLTIQPQIHLIPVWGRKMDLSNLASSTGMPKWNYIQ